MRANFFSGWLLGVSLTLNVGLVVLIGLHYRDFHRGPPDPRRAVERMAGDLPPADAQIVKQSYAAHEADIGAARGAMEGFADRMRDALRASPFDAGALTAAMDQGRAARDRLDAAVEAAFVEAAGRLSAEGRASLAARRGPPLGPLPGPPPGSQGFGPPPGPPPGPPGFDPPPGPPPFR